MLLHRYIIGDVGKGKVHLQLLLNGFYKELDKDKEV